MNIQRWLYRLLDLKLKAQEICPTSRIELTINESWEGESPMIHLTIYFPDQTPLEETETKLGEVQNWWFTMPYQKDLFVLIFASWD